MKYLFFENRLTGQLQKINITKETPKYFILNGTKVPKDTLKTGESFVQSQFYLETDESAISRFKDQTITNNFRKKISELLSIKDTKLMINLYKRIEEIISEANQHKELK